MIGRVLHLINTLVLQLIKWFGMNLKEQKHPLSLKKYKESDGLQCQWIVIGSAVYY